MHNMQTNVNIYLYFLDVSCYKILLTEAFTHFKYWSTLLNSISQNFKVKGKRLSMAQGNLARCR